ncbi:MAG: hypothetical protein K1X74_04050 [Pirellulales bacterium]|nr:hypothetical protein [Pirellulales bacterium]
MKLRYLLLCAIAVLAGCKLPGANNLPPAQMLMEPGPGVGGPGPGVLCPPGLFGGAGPGGAFMGQSSQLAFVGPDGMMVNWDVSNAGMFDSEPLVCPGRYNFPQGAIYRLKLTSIPGRPGAELYPTIEIAPALPRTEAYLAHNAIPVQFTEEDFDQVTSGNFVTKVIYLPDAEFQELALAGVETLVSTRLDPGLDPIVEADRRGAILAIIRLGNKDLQVPTAEGIAGGDGMVMPAGYYGGCGAEGCGPGGCVACGGAGGFGGAGAVGGMPPNFVSGVTSPEYGMTMSGTPIGLPGPPHVPLGIPAGLQKHVIANHTKVHIPGPTKKLRMDVCESPGFSYPKPPSHVSILEHTAAPPMFFRQGLGDKFQFIRGQQFSGSNPAACVEDNCVQ